MTYPVVPGSPNLPQIEDAVRRYWESDGTFQASIDQRPAGEDGANEFVFYDGPPFANGLPHYGHLLTGYVKDVVPRYQTMRGRRVERRFGWDCHGLPAEVEAEKQLGIEHKAQIEAMGVAAFNDACRASVLRYTKDWEEYVHRQARWVDFENDYKTLDLDYMESVMWAFKSLWDKGLVYEGFRVLAYCWRCETPLSNTETRMDDVYRQRQDPASTVWFELENGDRALAWTTMPWTLVPNVALVVGPDIDYVVVEHEGHRYVLAQARLAAYAKELAGARVVRTLKGSELVGMRYTPIFDFLVGRLEGTAAFTVLSGDFVSVDEGTGLVQVAPAHGEDDFAVCTQAGIPTVLTVDEQTRFTSIAPRFAGLQVFEANKPLLRELRERGVLVRQDSYDHPYPHCWRCGTPLVYKAVTSWFVEVTRVKDRMVELNQQIHWVPEHIRDGSFGKWLENARDWSISRNRYWGSPIPVWRSDDPAYPRLDVYGSLADLEADFGVQVADLHRPYVDQLTRPNPDDPTGRSTMRRVPEVLDCWFESGSMPFAQVHYPFENADWFEHHYPGDFIVEYIGQTRGWFYTMHVLATALFDRPAFVTCVSHGILLGDDGRKMSQEPEQLPRRLRGPRPRRVRRHALVPHVVPRPARGQPRGHRAGDPRRGAAGADPPVERLVLLHALREQRRRGCRVPGAVARRLPGRARPLRARQDPRPGRACGRADGRVRHRGGVPERARLPRRADELVRTAVPRAVLARGGRRLRHPLHGARGALPRGCAADAAAGRGGVARADRGPQRASDGLAGRREPALPTSRSPPRWTGRGRSRRRRSACARRRVFGCASHCESSPWSVTGRPISARSRACSPTR